MTETAAPTIAMVLAAGRGVRMRPLSDVIPKPALPLPDGPVVRWPLELASGTGARRIVVNTWHLAERMESALRQLELSDVEVVVSREPRLMGTAGGLALARDRGLLGDEGSVLVVNGDCVLHLDIQPLIADHARSEHHATVALLPHPDPWRWSRITVDDAGLVTNILAPGTTSPHEAAWLYPGVMVVSRAVINAIDSAPGDIPRHIWKPALEQGCLGGSVVSGLWREVGTPTDYLTAVLEHLRGGVVVHPSAHIAESAQLGSGFIGPDVQLEESTTVSDCVISGGAVVRCGGHVHRSVVIGPVVVDARQRIENEFRVAPLPS